MNFLKNLIGGQIVKGYSISGEAITGIGHHKQWKLYKGKRDSTGAQVSIFVIEKKSVKSSTREDILKSSRKQASSLAKIRHPGVLALIQPLTQDQHCLSFVTERVQGSLSSLLRSKKLQQFISSELQLKLNLFPLLETINFLHEIVKLCHLGLNMDSIYITHEGKWKLGGMNYVQILTGEEYQEVDGVEFYDLLHLPPEVVNNCKFNKLSDSYSLGILFINFISLLKKSSNNTLMQITQTKQAYNKNSKLYRDYAQFPAILQSTAPQELIQLLSQLLNNQPNYRLNVPSLQSSKWINDPIVLTVKYLEKISNYQNKQQVEFLKGLSGVIEKFSGKILHKRIIPILTNLLKFNHLVASIIFILLDIMKRNMLSIEEWRKTVWMELKPITQGKQMTAQSLYLLISNMQVLEKFLTQDNFMTCIIPLYLKCFDCPPKLKVLALKHVERLTKKYDYQFTKTKIVPKLVNTMKDDKIQIRKDGLKALYAIINRLDPLTIVNVVLTGLQNCRKAGADQFISSITVQIYNKITANMSAEILATKLMPALMPYLTDPVIEKQQFSLYKNALLKMIDKIQQQRKKTWNQQHQQQSIHPSYEKFSEKDFILQKLQVQSGGSTGKIQIEAKFDFLNQYKAMGSSSNISSYTGVQQQQRANENITAAGNNGCASQQQQQKQTQNVFKPTMVSISTAGGKQQTGVSLGSQVTQTTPSYQQQLNRETPQKPQSNHQEIKITDYSFGNFGKSNSFDFNFTNNSSKVDTAFGQNQYAFGQINNNDKKTTDYKSPTFDFNMNDNNGGFSFSSLSSNPSIKVQNKEMPFSPSTQPQINIPSKPVIKGPSDSGSKKLVGPPQGGIKKPPKNNEFNIPAQQQSQPFQNESFGFSSSFDNNIFSSSTSSQVNQFSTLPSQSPINNQFTIGNKNSDDPFAQVQQQYGITGNQNTNNNFNMGGNFNFGNFQNNSKPNNSEPFDDLL